MHASSREKHPGGCAPGLSIDQLQHALCGEVGYRLPDVSKAFAREVEGYDDCNHNGRGEMTDWAQMLKMRGRTLFGVEQGASGVRLLFSPDGAITIVAPSLELQAWESSNASLDFMRDLQRQTVTNK